VGTFVIDLLHTITDPEQFSDGIKALEMADEQIGVEINLQCRGGDLGATDRFIQAMRKCKGHIHICASGIVASAGTFVLLEADSFELSENFAALCHNGSMGNGGNFNEYAVKAEFDVKYMKKALVETYAGFFSREELEDMLKGVDIWLDADQWLIRHQARNEYMKAKYEALTAPPKKPRKRKAATE
jgi:ATP-dependent protease ClpP protease subunit